MDDEGDVGGEFRNSTVPNTGRRIVTTTSFEEDKDDERKVAVTAQESSDGICEKDTRIANLDQLEASSGAGRWSSSGRAENDRNKQVNAVERHEFEASNTKLEQQICRLCEESRISVESVHQQ